MRKYRKTLIAPAALAVIFVVLIFLITSSPNPPSPSHHTTTTTAPPATTTTLTAALTINPLTQGNKTLRGRAGSLVLLSPVENYHITSNLRYVAPTTLEVKGAFDPALHLLNPGTSSVTIRWPGHVVTFKVIVFTPTPPSSTTTTSTTTTTTTLPPSTISSLNPTKAAGKTITVANGATIYLTPVANYHVTTAKYKIVIYAQVKSSSSPSLVPALIALGPGTTKVSLTWPGHSSTFTLTVRPPTKPKHKL